MTLLIVLGLLAAIVYQWITQQVTVPIWGPWQVSFHRDEWPAFFWSVLAVEFGLAAFFTYWFFA